jgi:predicted MFS family arabinose efflux permease
MGLLVVCAITAISSTSLPAFFAALFLLGVGWNLMIVSGTTLLAQSYRPNERPKTQAIAGLFNNLAGSAGALSAGLALESIGWTYLNIGMAPILILSLIMILRWVRTRRPEAAYG